MGYFSSVSNTKWVTVLFTVVFAGATAGLMASGHLAQAINYDNANKKIRLTFSLEGIRLKNVNDFKDGADKQKNQMVKYKSFLKNDPKVDLANWDMSDLYKCRDSDKDTVEKCRINQDDKCVNKIMFSQTAAVFSLMSMIWILIRVFLAVVVWPTDADNKLYPAGSSLMSLPCDVWGGMRRFAVVLLLLTFIFSTIDFANRTKQPEEDPVACVVEYLEKDAGSTVTYDEHNARMSSSWVLGGIFPLLVCALEFTSMVNW